MDVVPTPQELVAVLYETLPDGQFKCRLCEKIRKPNSSGGNTNLAVHLTGKHRTKFLQAYRDLSVKPQSALTDYFKVVVDEKALDAYRWMDWIIKDHLPMAFCEKPRTRLYSTLNTVCVKTFKSYIHAVEKKVRERIQVCLADRPFGLLFDAWTEAGTHYVAVIAVTPAADDPSKAVKYLLSFAPLRDETQLTADAFVEHFDFVLERFALDAARLCFVVCDHASVNGKFCRDALVPMIGCASHRLQLAVGKILELHEDLLKKINDLMVRLDGVKNRAKLEDQGASMPAQRNATRWSSTFMMVKRFFEIREFIDRRDVKLAPLYPTPTEELQLESILSDLKKLESISKCLQCDPSDPDAKTKDKEKEKGKGRKKHALSLAEVRVLFDGVIKLFPAARLHLAPRSDPTQRAGNVVKSPDFESGVVKVLNGKESKLTSAEQAALVRLKQTDDESSEDEEDVSFADQLLMNGVNKPKSKYMDLRWIPATSNEVERLFSRAGLVLTERRQAMYPMTLENLLFLDYNYCLWDAYVVAQALSEAAANKKQRTS